MASRRTKLLRVGTVEGKRVEAEIFDYNNDEVMIKVEFIPEVLKDNPPFANDGRIAIVVKNRKYKDAIAMVESYLENLFLKELDNATDVPASSGARTDSGGNEENGAPDNEGKDQGKRDSASVHSSSRRKKPASSDRGGSEATALDEGSSEATSE